MRFSAISATLLIALFVAAVAASAKTPSYRVAKCPPGRAHVVAANRQAVVYGGPEEEGVTGPESKGEIRVFGCDNRHKVTYVLGVQLGECDAEGCEGIAHETLAGGLVAYAEIFSTGDSRGAETERSRSLLIVRDLRSGRVLRKLPTGTSTEPRDVGLGEPSSLVMRSTGAIAWIVYKTGVACPTAPVHWCYEVHVDDKSGARVVASGTDIDPLSLALAGSTLYWTQGGKPAATMLN
jgi:hypothetical protein